MRLLGVERGGRRNQATFFCFLSTSYLDTFADPPAKNADRGNAAAWLGNGRDNRSASQGHSSGTDDRNKELLLRALTPIEATHA
jgi:hypothetical protein